MAVDGRVAEALARRFALLRPHLDERQRRLLLGAEAAGLGRGGIKAVAAATGAHPDTVARGCGSWRGRSSRLHVRAAGGGRKKLSQSDPQITARLKELVDPVSRGDPMSLLGWTTKSTRNLARALTAMGHTGTSGPPHSRESSHPTAGQRPQNADLHKQITDPTHVPTNCGSPGFGPAIPWHALGPPARESR